MIPRLSFPYTLINAVVNSPRFGSDACEYDVNAGMEAVAGAGTTLDSVAARDAGRSHELDPVFCN